MVHIENLDELDSQNFSMDSKDKGDSPPDLLARPLLETSSPVLADTPGKEGRVKKLAKLRLSKMIGAKFEAKRKDSGASKLLKTTNNWKRRKPGLPSHPKKATTFHQMKQSLLKKKSFAPRVHKSTLFSKKLYVKKPKFLGKGKVPQDKSKQSSPLVDQKLPPKPRTPANRTSLTKKVARTKTPANLKGRSPKNPRTSTPRNLTKKTFHPKPKPQPPRTHENIYKSKRKQKVQVSLNLEKYKSRSLKKGVCQSSRFNLHKASFLNVSPGSLSKRTSRSTRKPLARPEAKTPRLPEPVSIANFQSLESEANSLNPELQLSRTETDRFYPAQPTPPKAFPAKDNIFYQDADSPAFDQVKRPPIQIFQNQVNNFSIKISQNFGTPSDQTEAPREREAFDLLLSGDALEKEVVYSNFNDHLEDEKLQEGGLTSKPLQKPHSLHLNSVHFDAPSTGPQKLKKKHHPLLKSNELPDSLLSSRRQASLDVMSTPRPAFLSDSLSGTEYLKGSEVKRLQLLANPRLHLDRVSKVEAFQVQGKWFLLSSSSDKTLKLWSVNFPRTEHIPEGILP